MIQEQSQKLYVPGKEVSIDESMIGTKARLSFLQYLPKKPTKWGVKVWVCSEAKTDTSTNSISILARVQETKGMVWDTML